MIEKRAKVAAEKEKTSYKRAILNPIHGSLNNHKITDITDQLKESGMDFTVGHVEAVICAMAEVVYNQAYEREFDAEIKNISQMLDFMKQEEET